MHARTHARTHTRTHAPALGDVCGVVAVARLKVGGRLDPRAALVICTREVVRGRGQGAGGREKGGREFVLYFHIER